MGELEGNQASVGDLARKLRLLLGAALLGAVLPACGGGGDSPMAAVESSSESPGDSSGSSSPGAVRFPSSANSDVAGDADAAAGFALTPGAVTLDWMPPTMNEDDTPLQLTGYRIYWGLVEGYYPYSVTLSNPGLSRYVVEQLAPATWYFVATALSDAGESEFSNSIALQVP